MICKWRGSCVVYTRLFVVDCCSFSSDALALSVQGSVQWSTILESDCGEALVFCVQSLCSGFMTC